MLAYKSITTMKNKPYHMNAETGIKLQQVGLKRTEILNTEPEYEIHINAVNDDVDAINFDEVKS